MQILTKWTSFIIAVAFSGCSFAECHKDIPAEGLAECKYNKFTVWLSCNKKAALVSWAVIGKDQGSENTSRRNYFLDDSASKISCQQTSNKRYTVAKKGYDVGHLTAIDHFDDDIVDALQTNVMTNMVPQASSFNRTGAWKRTETLVECYRDEDYLSPLHVYAGTIFGNDLSNDHFSVSHGLAHTPDFMWKLIYSPSAKKYDAWIMLNDNSSKVATLEESRRTLPSLISSLTSQNDNEYLPVIKALQDIQKLKPQHIKMHFGTKCNRRRG